MGGARESRVSGAPLTWAYKIHTRFGPVLLESVYEAVPAPQSL